MSQNFGAGLVVGVILAVLSHGEREHIRGGVDIPVLPVHLLDLVVIYKGDADLRRILKSLQLEHRVAAAPDEHADARGDFHRFLLI